MVGIVSGYDSDGSSSSSDAEAPSSQVKTSAQSSGLFASLPAPSQTGVQTGVSNGAAPPKRKRQIRVGGSAPGEGSDDAGEAQPELSSSKRAKVPEASATGSGHSLFGMLPAPSKRAPTPPKQANQSSAEQGQRALEVRDQGDDEASSFRKGNDHFRAMLGLQPTARKERPSGQVPRKAASQPEAMQGATSSEEQRPPHDTAATPLQSHVANPAHKTSRPQEAAPSESLDEASTMDFFGIPQARASSSSQADRHRAVSAISSAPAIEETQTYPGWMQNPDGSWSPVTPDAQQQWAAQQAADDAMQAGNVESRELSRLKAAGILDLNTLRSVNASEQAKSDEWHRKPHESGSTTGMDSKYAAAAAESASTAPHQQQQQPDEPSQRNNRTQRARRHGQLSALFSQADEKRESLEEKWAQGRANRRGAADRYGF
ncbi:unnamed protein product [Jaminaea pallidilutea]